MGWSHVATVSRQGQLLGWLGPAYLLSLEAHVFQREVCTCLSLTRPDILRSEAQAASAEGGDYSEGLGKAGSNLFILALKVCWKTVAPKRTKVTSEPPSPYKSLWKNGDQIRGKV